MKKFLTVVAVLVSLPVAAEEPKFKELYMPNAAGGFMVLTVEDCKVEAQKELFPYHAYATVEGDRVVEEGCWMTPDISGAEIIPGMTIIPIVNTWWAGEIHHFPQTHFTPLKQRWPEPEFKGDL